MDKNVPNKSDNGNISVVFQDVNDVMSLLFGRVLEEQINLNVLPIWSEEVFLLSSRVKFNLKSSTK